MVTSPSIRVLDAYQPSAPTSNGEPDALREELQSLTHRIAFSPDSWGPSERERMRHIFDERAETWRTRDNPAYRLPLLDALARGGVAPGGTCLEMGAGTGIHTAALAAHFTSVLSFDLAFEMLAETGEGPGHLACADAADLPLRDDAVDAVVLVNVPLFSAEYARVLTGDGAVVFVSTRGADTPIYLAPEDVVASLSAFGGAAFTATSAAAAGGRWTVARRAGAAR